MIFSIPDNLHFAAVRENVFAFRHGFFRIVGSLGVNRRFQDIDDSYNVRFIEQHDVIDALQRRNQDHAFVFVENRTSRVLDGPNGDVAVDRDNQRISQGLCSFQIPQMTNMEYVETTVRQDNLLPSKTVTQIFKPAQLHGLAPLMAFFSSFSSTGRVPYFITTIPPA